MPRDSVDVSLDVAMATIAAASGDEIGALERLAEAWDADRIGPDDLLPRQARIGSARVAAETGLRDASVAFIALVALRPVLAAYFAPVRDALGDREWALGICPFCGAPPGFADIVEDGRRRLACHVCDGAWLFSRTRCPSCGSDATDDAVRLELGDREEGYAIAACTACSSYLKELDRRVRWNGGPALVEDWGSPHFDLVARRRGFWRACPTLLDVAQRA